ncbi:hypothetical protein Mth01_18150 [Sphaerimonospora thailandensis]|uniref:Lipoprotein n=2 Tax=Sphaerimonospora thailandensis TaxID=795644 RepID=A0A8J3R5N6_9ACTN|nr:hypothetical protein Mth01_18150 [Sphaerimonospora thailandensis]
MRRGVVTVVAALVVAGCTAESERPVPPPAVAFTRGMAEAVLAEVVAGVGRNGVADFCATFARSKETCDILLRDALRGCLLPGDKPTVKSAVRLPATGKSEETWRLVVQGRTLDGQKYVSDFPVIRSAGVPKAALAIYWIGLGYGEDMDDPPDYTVIPQNACPK